MQFATTGDFIGVRALGFGDADSHVGFGFFQQTVTNDARLDLVAFTASQRAVVHAHSHRDGRRIDRQGRQGFVDFQSAQGIGHGRLGHTSDGDDIARFGFIHRLTLQTTEGQNLGDTALFNLLAVTVQSLDGHTRNSLTRVDAARQDATEERIGLDQNVQDLERLGDAFLSGRRRHVRDDQFVQVVQVVFRIVEVHRGPARTARCVDDREVELFVGGTQSRKQVEGFVQNAVRIGVCTVNLVDAQDRTQAHAQGLGQNELGLRHHTFFGVNQQDASVHHAQDALDLAAEVGVTRGVDDVDAGFAGLTVPQNGGALGKNGDTAFFFLIAGVHGTFRGRLVGAENARLGQEGVNHGRLAVVNVCDNSDVTKVHFGLGRTVFGHGRPAPLQLDADMGRISVRLLQCRKSKGQSGG